MKYSIEVYATLRSRYEVEASNLDSAHLEAMKMADKHLRDDGELIYTNSALVTRSPGADQWTPEQIEQIKRRADYVTQVIAPSGNAGEHKYSCSYHNVSFAEHEHFLLHIEAEHEPRLENAIRMLDNQNKAD